MEGQSGPALWFHLFHEVKRQKEKVTVDSKSGPKDSKVTVRDGSRRDELVTWLEVSCHSGFESQSSEPAQWSTKQYEIYTVAKERYLTFIIDEMVLYYSWL